MPPTIRKIMRASLRAECQFGRWYPFVYVLLVVAGLCGNYFSYPIFLNIDFLFGGIFAMLALQVFGLRAGTLAAALIASYTFVLWNHPYAAIIMTAEVAVVGYLMTQRRLGMVLADAIYWLILGIPLVFVFYHFILKVPDNGIWIIAVKQALNGLATSLMARLIYSAVGLVWPLWQRSLREVIYNLLILFVLAPSLLILAISSRADFERVDLNLRTELAEHHTHVKNLFQLWVQDRSMAVEHLASLAETLSPPQMQERLDQLRNTDQNILRIGMRDKDSVVAAYSPRTDQTGVSNVGKKFPERPYIETIRRSGKSMLAEVVKARIDAPEPIAILVAPIVRQGRFDGYVNAVLKLGRIQLMLQQGLQTSNSIYTLIDQNGNIIMSNDPQQSMMKPMLRHAAGTIVPVGGGFSRWTPTMPANTSISDRWRKSYYFLETPLGLRSEWKLIYEEPIAPIQNQLYTQYASNMSLVFVLALIAIVLAEFLSRRSVATLHELNVVTRELPSLLDRANATVAWPHSAMEETSELINNFKTMATSLQGTFNQLKVANATLEQRVSDRTNELQLSERRFRNLIEWSPEPMVVHRDGKFVYVNPAALKLFGAASGDQIIGTAVLDRVHPDDRAVVIERIQRGGGEGAVAPMVEARSVRLDGSVIDTEVSAALISFDGAPSIQAVIHDVTQSKRNLAQIATLLREQQAVLNNELVGIVRVIDRKIVWANSAFETMMGYGPGAAQGTPTRQVYSDDVAFRRLGGAAYPILAAGKVFRTQIELVRCNGERIWVDMSGATLNHAIGESLWTFNDVTEHKKIEDMVRQHAYHDELTKLPNRRMLEDRMNKAMASGRRSGVHGAVMFLDLDNFKPLNDQYGHEAGDLLLIEVARRLTASVREADTVARIGGDEFVVLIGELATDRVESLAQTQLIAEKVRRSLARPYVLSVPHHEAAFTTIEHLCSASIGVVVFVGQEFTQAQILDWADQAMYRAKDAGRNAVRYYEFEANERDGD